MNTPRSSAAAPSMGTLPMSRAVQAPSDVTRLTWTGTTADVVEVPVLSVARAVRWWVPSGAFFHTISYGAEAASPTFLSSA